MTGNPLCRIMDAWPFVPNQLAGRLLLDSIIFEPLQLTDQSHDLSIENLHAPGTHVSP